MKSRLFSLCYLHCTLFVILLPGACVHHEQAHTQSIPNSSLYQEVFDHAVPHEFIIEISQQEWDGVTQDMLDYAETHPVSLLYEGDGRPYRTDNYRKANFIYRRPNGEEIRIDGVGFRTRGNESRRLPVQNGQFYKSHFKVKFNETFDLAKDDPKRAAIKDRDFAGMKALNFKWSRYNTWDTYANQSKINELFSYQLLNKVGVDAPRMSLATLTFRIDGREVRYGVYGVVEHVDKAFLQKRYDASGGDLYKCLYLGGGAHLTQESLQGDRVGIKDPDRNYRPTYDLKTNKTRSRHVALREFVDQLNNLEGEEFKTFIDSSFEVDSFIRYLAIGIYINNLDDYRFLANNYYLYFNPEGKVSFIPYDFDISLGTNWHGDLNYKEFIDQDIFNTTNIPSAWGDHSTRPLVDKILAVPEYRNRYLRYLKDFVQPENRVFQYSEYYATFQQLFGIYGNKTENDTADADPMGLLGYEQKFFTDKTRNVLNQLEALGL